MSESRKRILTAKWLFTAIPEVPLQQGWAVALNNHRILEVASFESLKQNHPEARITDFGDAVVLPGLVNSHVHLELTNHARPLAPASFAEWLLSMPRNAASSSVTPKPDPAAATLAGIDQCLRFGVTCVGDISQQTESTRPILRDSRLRAVSFGEVIGLAKRRSRFEDLLPRALDSRSATERLAIGISPHSPYTVQLDDIRRCVQIAREQELPLAIHLAESPDESQFLAEHAGPLREMWNMLGTWSDFDPLFAGGPVRLARSLGLLKQPSLLAHVNYCDDAELEILAQGQASVVYCPRTHRYFNHPPHRWRDMLAAGINVAVGTDSAASSPDLNLADDLRLLRQISPQFPAEVLWSMATHRAARAIGLDHVAGSIAAGKDPCFVIFNTTSDQPLVEVLDDPTCLPHEVWIAGEPVKNIRPVSPC